MQQKKYVIGVDVGTGSARAGVFTPRGERLGMSVEPIRMWREGADSAEQSSDDIWRAVGVATRTAVAEARAAPEDVAGIGFDATCSLVVLGAQNRPVTVSASGESARNVIVWMDHRALAEADEINQGEHDVLRYVGGRISPEMEPPKLLWLKRHLPETYRNAAKFLDLADFLTYQATGNDVRSLCTNVCKWGYLGHENRWDRDFYEKIGLSDLWDNERVTNRIRPLGERIGPLTPEAAAHLGLSTNCQVGVGAIDAHAGGLGLLGAALPEDTEPDLDILETVIALIGGTSNCHMAASRAPVFVPGVWGPYFGAMVPGLWLTEGGQSAAGSLIDFSFESLAVFPELAEKAAAQHLSVHQLLNNLLDQMAARENLPDPALLTRDLHVLDYHLGNRSPFADPHARGVVDGLTLDSGEEMAARLYLATVQAVAYGTRQIIETLNAAGFHLGKILVTGGGTKNPLWLREHANATGLLLITGHEPESVLLGAAVLGAAAANVHNSVLEAMQRMSQAGATTVPRPETRAFHDAKYQVYQSLYQSQQRHREIMRVATVQ